MGTLAQLGERMGRQRHGGRTSPAVVLGLQGQEANRNFLKKRKILMGRTLVSAQNRRKSQVTRIQKGQDPGPLWDTQRSFWDTDITVT